MERNLELLKAFREIPTGNISDAMTKLNLPSGVLVDAPRAVDIHQPRMAGYACTVLQMPRHQTSEGKNLSKHLSVINSVAEEGDVLVVDVGGRQDVCSGGGMLALRAKVRGLSGFLINGCYRDIADVVDEGFPLFCRGSIPTKSSPLLETVGINVTVTIGGIQIRPGDLIVGDDTGIVVIPTKNAQDILRVAERIKKVETRMTELILTGMDYTECRKKAEAEFPEV